MKTILSYRVPLDDPAPEVSMPAGAVLLDAGLPGPQTAPKNAVLWAVVDVDANMVRRRFVVVQEGQAGKLSDNAHYVATVGTPDGARIWHLFDAGTSVPESNASASSVPAAGAAGEVSP